MQISEFQLTLDEEADLVDSLSQTLKNLKSCKSQLSARLTPMDNSPHLRISNYKSLNILSNNNILSLGQSILSELSASYSLLPSPDILLTILTRSSAYIPKHSAEILLKTLSHSPEDNLPNYFQLSNQIWKAKKQSRRLEDDYTYARTKNREFLNEFKSNSFKLNQLKLEIGLIKTEINTLGLCIQSFLKL